MIPNIESPYQEIFDYVAEKVYLQGEPSFDKKELVCVYRAGSLKCAIGWLIPDEQYNPEFDNGLNLKEVFDMLGWDIWDGLDDPDVGMFEKYRFFSDLQRAHDGALESNFRSDYIARMNAVAKTFELSTDILEKLIAK